MNPDHHFRTRVVVTGMGWVTPLGHTIEGVWRRLLSGDSGVGATTLFDAGTFPTPFSAEVRGYDLTLDLECAKSHQTAGRSTRFALGSCAQAWRAAGLENNNTLNLDRVGIYLAGGEGSLDFDAFTSTCLASFDSEIGKIDFPRWGRTAMSQMDAIRELEQEPHLALSHLALMTGARGPALNSLTACAAGAQAIGEATAILCRGDADIMITGGAHSMIHPLGVTGFNRLTALSTFSGDPRQASRPFDAHRAGFVLGEGAGIVILETQEHATVRGAPILAEVLGYGSTADAYRITDQHPQSEGMIGAMRAALADARLAPKDIHYINAHGTGTRENDSHESAAIRSVFGDIADRVPLSSIKSMFGHFITAAGAVEFIACVLALRDQILPPTINLRTPDPACDLDYVPNVARPAKLDVVLSNNIGFGGQNDTLVLGRFHPRSGE